MGWVTLAIPLLRSNASPLDTGKITIEEMSWIASIMPLGAIAGNCFCGIFVALFGARHTIVLIGFPQLVKERFSLHSIVHLITERDRVFTYFSFHFRLVGLF